jgi:predicted ATPase
MYISSVQISNYMAFRESNVIRFKPGFNIVVGKNNVGKTALLQTLRAEISSEPHRSLRTMPESDQGLPSKRSSAVLVFSSVEKAVIANLVLQPDRQVVLPRFADPGMPDHERVMLVRTWLQRKDPSEITYTITGRSGGADARLHSLGPYNLAAGYSEERYRLREDGHVGQTGTSGPQPVETTVVWKLLERIRQGVYYFDAERPRLGTCPFGPSDVLKPNASNLPEVLDVLSKNPRRYQRYNEYVSLVLPMVEWVSVKNKSTGHLEAHIWMIDPETEREDLSIPLLKCGTGVGQVLAMLYVVFTSERPKTIIIDEPQSFLHPSAIRELIEVFKLFPKHQYIIATHSPLIVSAAHPCTISQITHDGNEAIVAQSDSEDPQAIGDMIEEVGLKLSDVFATDSFFWVEGETEEKCFPLVLEKVAKHPMHGTHVLAVRDTGDFRQKKKQRVRLVFSIYTRLSTGQVLFPPAVGFLFDREGLSDADIEDFRRESPRPVEFLPRRLYENYLLFPEAIAAVLNGLDTERGDEVTTESVRQSMNEKAEAGAYLLDKSDQVAYGKPRWYETVDGAGMLRDLFADLSDNRIQYQKTRDSTALTEWLVENRPEALGELGRFLKDFLNRCKRTP